MKKIIGLWLFIGLAFPAYAENICQYSNESVLPQCDASGYLQVDVAAQSGVAEAGYSNVEKVYHGSSADTVLFKAINVDGADSDEVIAAVAGDKIRVLGYAIVCDGAVNVTFEEGGGTDLTGAIPLAANGGVSYASSFGAFETSAGAALNILKSAAQSCDGHIAYAVVD